MRMIEDEVFEGIEGKCAVEASPTDTSDLQLALTAMEEEYSDLCFRKSEVRLIRVLCICWLLPTNQSFYRQTVRYWRGTVEHTCRVGRR